MHSPAAQRNQDSILEVLKLYELKGRLLEVGTGSAQHAVHFATHFYDLHWVTSDQPKYRDHITETLKKSQIKNLHGPEKLTIGKDDFPKGKFDYVFTANTLHIMSWKECKSFIKLCGKRLREGSLVFIYGPFKRDQQFTSAGDEALDLRIKEKSPTSGIRGIEEVINNFEKAGFKKINEHSMPANNLILVFERLKFHK